MTLDSLERRSLARANLIEAFALAQIPEQQFGKYMAVCYRVSEGDIELLVHSYSWPAGALSAKIGLQSFAENVVDVCGEDKDEILATLTSAARFLKTSLGSITTRLGFETMARRAKRLSKTSNYGPQLRKSSKLLLEPMLDFLNKQRREAERDLRADGRLGSDAKYTMSDEQCIDLYKHYIHLHPHWKRTKARSKKEANWREYAVVDEADTPTELLDRLDESIPQAETSEDYPNIPSVLALEHAARRIGIPPNIYSSSRLKDFRQRGQELFGQMKST